MAKFKSLSLSFPLFLGISVFASTDVHTQQKQDCAALFISMQSPSVQGLLAFRCQIPSETLSSEGKKFYSFFSRLKTGNWNSYPWSIGPKELRGFIAVETFAKGHRWVGLWSLAELLSDMYYSHAMKDPTSFIGFIIRVKPCTNGDWGRYLAGILTSEFEKNPGAFTKMLLSEEKRYNTWVEAGGKDYCQNEEQKSRKGLLGAAFSKSLNMIWGSFKRVPEKSQESFRHFLTQARSDSNLSGFMQAYNQSIDAEK